MNEFKFTATIVLVVSGEAKLSADNMDIYTAPDMNILPVVVFHEELDLEPAERALAARTIAYNVVHRALAELKIPGITTGVPMPVVGDVPPGERS